MSAAQNVVVKPQTPKVEASKASPSVSQSPSVVEAKPAQNMASGLLPESESGLADEEAALLALYGDSDGSGDLDSDTLNELRDMDFSFDPDAEGEMDDAEDEGSATVSHTKTVAAAKNGGLTGANAATTQKSVINEAEQMLLRWKNIVESLKVPVSTICSHAVVKKFERTILELTFNSAFRGLIAPAYEEQVTREIRQLFGWSVRLVIAFEDNVDEASTIAAEAARAEVAAESQAKEALLNHPLFKAVVQNFHLNVEPDKVQFTFNRDRISK